MRVCGAWIEIYYVLCSETYSTFGIVLKSTAVSRQTTGKARICETRLLNLHTGHLWNSNWKCKYLIWQDMITSGCNEAALPISGNYRIYPNTIVFLYIWPLVLYDGCVSRHHSSKRTRLIRHPDGDGPDLLADPVCQVHRWKFRMWSYVARDCKTAMKMAAGAAYSTHVQLMASWT